MPSSDTDGCWPENWIPPHIPPVRKITHEDQRYPAFPLMEVLSVFIDYKEEEEGEGEGEVTKKRSREDRGFLYGKIVVQDPFGEEVIYDRPSGGCGESICPGVEGDSISLSAPTRAIPAFDTIIIHVDLVYKVEDQPDEVFKGDVCWYASYYSRKYDEDVATSIEGHSLSATLSYIVLGAAVLAHVEVTLLDLDDDKDSACVSGSITASSDLDELTYETDLFRAGDGEGNTVARGGVIPLSKSAVAVHKTSYLEVRAALCARFGAGSQNLKIASGVAHFSAQESGKYVAELSGAYGKIQVMVTWSLT